MSRPRTLEQQLLARSELRMNAFTAGFNDRVYETRLQLLETVASLVGGFSIDAYHDAFSMTAFVDYDTLISKAREVLAEIETTPIPVPLALSALSREPIAEMTRRNRGSYHTDFRLARRLAELAAPDLGEDAQIIDPACGSGMLLSALTSLVCQSDRGRAAAWLADSVYAADLSEAALRSTLLSLACFTADIDLLRRLRAKWCAQDSLMVSDDRWHEFAPHGFDVVIANPPWEKVKLTRHEFLRDIGSERHYGAVYDVINLDEFGDKLEAIGSYVDDLLSRYKCLSAEPDLYMAFLELFLKIVKPGGRICALVPAGLIRSQRTTPLRHRLLKLTRVLKISVLENRARFFNIDTRFKFLALGCELLHRSEEKRTPIQLLHETGTATGISEYGRARIPRAALRSIRKDLTIPEVRGDREWNLFASMSSVGVSWDSTDEQWRPHLMREVDMTRERRHFSLVPRPGLAPLVEGRMIQQHRFGAKTYIRGTGRRAIWRNNPLGCSRISPQFWIDPKYLSSAAHARMNSLRIGFCDITGQTNERSMMAAIVPPGVACGNKVPTIVFPDDPTEERLLLSVAIVNSLPFDWLMRRIVTTTVNYFLLMSLPLPPIGRDTLPGRHLIGAAQQLRHLDAKPQVFEDSWTAAELRAQIDIAVSVAYGLGLPDLTLLLDDFPLMDRGQPPLPGESRSTITRDFLLMQAVRRLGGAQRDLSKRVLAAKDLGAIPYVPSEVTLDISRPEDVDYA